MKNGNLLLGLGVVIFSISQLQTIQNAYAMGPHISMGSNPIVNINGTITMTSITTTTIWSNTTQYDFIVTTFLQNQSGCYLTVDGQTSGLA